MLVAIDKNTSPASSPASSPPSSLHSSGELEGRDVVVQAEQTSEKGVNQSEYCEDGPVDKRTRDLVLFLLSAGAHVTLVARSSEVGLREMVEEWSDGLVLR